MAREDGETAAHVSGDLNEIRGDLTHNQPGYEKNMDKWNNSVGRDIGKARKRKLSRWSRQTRNGTPIEAVALNPERDVVVSMAVHSACGKKVSAG